MKIMQTLLELEVGKICCREWNKSIEFGFICETYMDSLNKKVVVVVWETAYSEKFYVESFRTYHGKLDPVRKSGQPVYIINEKEKLALQIKRS